MKINRKTYGILFSKADLVSVEDYLFMKQCLDEKLVDTIFFVPSYIFNDGNEIYMSRDVSTLENYNKEILSTIPEVMIWTNEMMLFEKILSVDVSSDKTLHLIDRLNKTRCPEDIILAISTCIDYHNSSNIMKIIVNSTLLNYKTFTSNDSGSMWETFNCLTDGIVIDSLQLSEIKNKYKDNFLQFEQINKINTNKYRQTASISRPDYGNLSIHEAIEKNSHDPVKYVEIFKTLAKLLIDIKFEEHEKSCENYTFAILFEENDSLLLHLNDNNELEPLTYICNIDEVYPMTTKNEHMSKAYVGFIVNKVLKETTGYDIPAEYAILLNKVRTSDGETAFYYLNFKDIPANLHKHGQECVDRSKLKRIPIIRSIDGNLILAVESTDIRNSKILQDALNCLQALGLKNESNHEENLSSNKPSETLIENEPTAIAPYQWNFLNFTKLTISVTCRDLI